METPVRVVIADDDVLLREGVASLLERAGFEVVGQAGDGTELLDVVRDVKPDLVVADIRMPPTHTTEGLTAARVIREEAPDIAILVLSQGEHRSSTLRWCRSSCRPAAATTRWPPSATGNAKCWL
jgi:DNA-binding NarL/FixJ family response regulator